MFSSLTKAFSDHRLVFGNRTTSELLRRHFLLSLCGNKWVAKNAAEFLLRSVRLLGARPLAFVFRPLIYDLFVAGEHRADIVRFMRKLALESKGARPFLSPMLEDDPDDAAVANMNAETRDQIHDRNLAVIRECISTCADRELETVQPRILAIKLTAFIRATHLEAITEVMHESGKSIRELMLDIDTGLDENEKQFIVIPGREERQAFFRGCGHLKSIVEESRQNGVRLLIDAEHSHLQPAVRLISLALMRRYNAGAEATVTNTYQCYLRHTENDLDEDLTLARQLRFNLGCKLVRGAYMEYERNKSSKEGTQCPVFDTYEETSRSYDSAVKKMLSATTACLDNLLIVATHNEQSALAAAQVLSEARFANVHFAQINGMADHLTIGLASNGFSSLKMVPCGSMSDVLPWLARRLRENADAAARTKVERRLIRKELLRRAIS